MTIRSGAALAALLLTAGVHATEVHEFQLDNGMKILVKEDHRAPVAVAQVWYKVGSSYEYDGITGVSHVLEHMMFKGTEKHAPGEFSRIIAEHGGRENAFTSRDYTAYFQQLEASRLPISFEMEADRMRNLVLLEEEFAKEVQVVMEERRMRTEDNPQSLTYEQFNATAFLSSPYRIPTIGWMDDLENLALKDLEHWYAQWYAPNNATLVVAGDVDPQEILALAKQYYGPHKPSDIEPAKPRAEFAQRGQRRIQVEAPAELPYLLMGYKTPALIDDRDSWEPYALEVLAQILDGGDSARFARNLVRGSRVAASAGASYDFDTRQGSLFLMSAVPASGRTVAEVEAALRAEIKALREAPVTTEELARVKAQTVANEVYEQDSIFYQAMQLGTAETVGLGWKVREEYVEKIQAVTAEQVQQVAQKYLVDGGLTLAELVPQPMDADARMRAARARAGGGHGR